MITRLDLELENGMTFCHCQSITIIIEQDRGISVMLEAERHRLILNLLRERSVASIQDLVDILDASEATVRRDINGLADAGRIRRIRGGAEALTPHFETHLVGVPYALNLTMCAAQKRAIAQAAAALIEDGESILINGGTTTYGLVEFLADKSLDILTNSLPIVTQLMATSRNRITLPGGTIYREQNIVLSPYENDAIEHFWGKKLFTGCYGLNRFGLMEADPLIVQAELKLLKRCEEIIVLADSRKLRQRSAMVVTDLKRISTLITDRDATADELDPFRNVGIRVVQVDFEGEESDDAITQVGNG
jgi:DeoR family transcriptional regulator, ulaG and ulaABCDEF operon transcriptional repressor